MPSQAAKIWEGKWVKDADSEDLLFKKHGDLLCAAHVCVRLDKLISRKGLNACQARKYKSHRIPSDIIAFLAIQDPSKSS